MTAAVARDVRPPLFLVRVLNPVIRVVLRTPIGRLVPPLALLEFHGRRSGRRFRVPVGWHQTDTGPVVCTPAQWRANFGDGLAVTVWSRGRRRELVGRLDDDPERVATALQCLAEDRGSLRRVGIDLPPGHQVGAADVIAVNRAIIRFASA